MIAKRIPLLIYIFTILVLLSAGCASVPETTEPSTTEVPEVGEPTTDISEVSEPATDVPEVSEPATDVPETEPEPTEAPSEPRILKVRLTEDIASLDPAFYPGWADTIVMFTIDEGLVGYKPGSWEIVNVLAESIGESDDGLSISFKLKEGIQFHGGYGEVTAEDVKFSYERFIDPELNSPFMTDWQTLDYVEVVDKYSGVIHLTGPFAPLWVTTLPVGGGHIISKAAYEEMGFEAYQTHPISTGPYEFVEWVPDQEVVLKRFVDYHGEIPFWDEIHFIPILDDSAAEIALETGEVDIGRISPTAIERFEANDDLDVVQVGTLDYNGLLMNVQHPQLEDVNVRNAIKYALDIPSILEAAYEGVYDRACHLISPNYVVGSYEDGPCVERDVEAAKEYLAAAGLETLDIELRTLNHEAEKIAAEVMQANLAEVGINLEINVQDEATYWDYGFGETGIEQQQLTHIPNWGSNGPDPYWAIVWFTCEQVGEWNWMEWCNEEFQALHEEALEVTDLEARDQLYRQMAEIMDEEDVGAVWIAHPNLIYGVNANIEPCFYGHGRPCVAAIRLKE